MTGFSIGFTGETVPGDAVVALGEIRLGEYRESFASTTEFWSIRDYEHSWAQALRHLLSGALVSCLATEIVDPKAANFERVWALYREGDVVHVQELLVFLDELNGEFDPARPWDAVPPRETVDEDGNTISEWTVPLSAIREFVDAQSER